MEPLRLAQRRVLREVFRELSATSSRQAIRQQRRLLHGHAPSQRPSNTAFSNTTRSPIQSRIRSLQHTSRARPQQHSSNPFTQRPFRRHASTSTSSNPSAEGSLSLSQRLKKLTREYGWSALGVYLALSALDFPFCFLGVRTLGTERIGYLEHEALSFLKMVVQWPMAKMGWEWGESEIEKGSKEVKQGLKEMEIPVGEPEKQGPRLLDDQPDSGTKYGEAHGVEEAEKANKGEGASIWTQLALAYAIHKSFIFIRVPLTAAVTPKVVKTLRGWGWNIGKRTPTAASTAKGGTGVAAQKGTGINTK